MSSHMFPTGRTSPMGTGPASQTSNSPLLGSGPGKLEDLIASPRDAMMMTLRPELSAHVQSQSQLQSQLQMQPQPLHGTSFREEKTETFSVRGFPQVQPGQVLPIRAVSPAAPSNQQVLPSSSHTTTIQFPPTTISLSASAPSSFLPHLSSSPAIVGVCPTGAGPHMPSSAPPLAPHPFPGSVVALATTHAPGPMTPIHQSAPPSAHLPPLGAPLSHLSQHASVPAVVTPPLPPTAHLLQPPVNVTTVTGMTHQLSHHATPTAHFQAAIITEAVAKTAKLPLPTRPIAPAPATLPTHPGVQAKMPSHVTVPVTDVSPTPPGPFIPVATISGQQGQPGVSHHQIASMQIICSSVPSGHISHLPRGAAVAAAISAPKGVTTTVLRSPVTPMHQSRIAMTGGGSSTGSGTIAAGLGGLRNPAPTITTATVSHGSAESIGRSSLAASAVGVGIQPQVQSGLEPLVRFPIPSHSNPGLSKLQLQALPQKTLLGPPIAVTVAPIQGGCSTGLTPVVSQAGTSTPHAIHSQPASVPTIPVAKVIPQQQQQQQQQPPRLPLDFPPDRPGSFLTLPGAHRSSPNPATASGTVTMDGRGDGRTVPILSYYHTTQYPTLTLGYPISGHHYAPITTSVTAVRPLASQSTVSAIAGMGGVGGTPAMRINPVLVSMDPSRSFPPLSASTASTPANQGPPESKPTGVVLAESVAAGMCPSSFAVTSPSSSGHNPNTPGSGQVQASSPRPSILRRKTASEGSAVRKTLIPTDTSSPRGDGARGSGSPRPLSEVAMPPDVHTALAFHPASDVTTFHTDISLSSLRQPTQHPLQISSATTAPGSLSVTMVPAAAAPTSASVLAGLGTLGFCAGGTMGSGMGPGVVASSAMVTGIVLPEIKVKQEQPEGVDGMVLGAPPSSTRSGLLPALCSTGGEIPAGTSPRKKPRKQQHVVSAPEESEMLEGNSTDDEEKGSRAVQTIKYEKLMPPKEYVDEEGVRYVPVKLRPPVTLLSQYRNPWKAAFHHFQCYPDVRVKEEKKASLQDMAAQKGLVSKVQGWKVQLCASQLMQLVNLENEVYEKMSSLQEGIMPQKKKGGGDEELHKVYELIQGNLQRCKLVMDQITEARESMMRVLDHKEHVLKLLNKSGNARRGSKRKEKA
uniref:Sin3A-associated protein a n=1 Tax=Eptatretus burgeri TaxID=7764 RepID=A0A8C4NBN4_EPTBU